MNSDDRKRAVRRLVRLTGLSPSELLANGLEARRDAGKPIDGWLLDAVIDHLREPYPTPANRPSERGEAVQWVIAHAFDQWAEALGYEKARDGFAELLDVSPSTVEKWRKKWRGKPEPP